MEFLLSKIQSKQEDVHVIPPFPLPTTFFLSMSAGGFLDSFGGPSQVLAFPLHSLIHMTCIFTIPFVIRGQPRVRDDKHGCCHVDNSENWRQCIIGTLGAHNYHTISRAPLSACLPSILRFYKVKIIDKFNYFAKIEGKKFKNGKSFF